jgi:hypothetical protein
MLGTGSAVSSGIDRADVGLLKDQSAAFVEADNGCMVGRLEFDEGAAMTRPYPILDIGSEPEGLTHVLDPVSSSNADGSEPCSLRLA